MSFYYNSNEICFQKIDLNWAFIDIYKGFFPDICPHSGHDQNFSAWTDIMNGPYGSNAVWYGMFSQAGEPYDWSHLLAFCTVGAKTGSSVQILYNFAVLSDYQRMGYGSQLLNFIIGQLDADKNIYLFVKKDNRGALRLYRKFYFEFDDQSFLPPAGEICLVRHKDNYMPIQPSNLAQATGLLKKSESPL